MPILVAGVGNLFFGDDAFGVEVARQLIAAPPPNAIVTDFGIRALHLAYELLAPYDLCIVADCMPRGGAPGTLYVLEPDVDAAMDGISDAHGMNMAVVFSTVRQLGGQLPRMLVVGCEPQQIEAGIGLSPNVLRAVPEALLLIRELINPAQEVVP